MWGATQQGVSIQHLMPTTVNTVGAPGTAPASLLLLLPRKWWCGRGAAAATAAAATATAADAVVAAMGHCRFQGLSDAPSSVLGTAGRAERG